MIKPAFKLCLFLVLICYLPSLKSQEKTLISGEIESTGYGGPLVRFGSIYGENGVFVGGQGAWRINHKFGVGGRGYGLANTVPIRDLNNVQLGFGCGGLLLEYVINSDNLVHFDVNAMIGAGGLTYEVTNYDLPHTPFTYKDDGFFVLEPGAHIVLNVTRYFRIAGGAAYRYVSGVDNSRISDLDLSGFSGEIVFLFGVF